MCVALENHAPYFIHAGIRPLTVWCPGKRSLCALSIRSSITWRDELGILSSILLKLEAGQATLESGDLKKRNTWWVSSAFCWLSPFPRTHRFQSNALRTSCGLLIHQWTNPPKYLIMQLRLVYRLLHATDQTCKRPGKPQTRGERNPFSFLSNKKLVVTSATLVVTGALLVVTRS